MGSQVENASLVDDIDVAARRLLDRRLLWAAGIAAAVGLLLVLYVMEARTKPLDGDGASQVVQAWDMLHGNVLLHGWWVADVSFYTVDIPEYALVETFTGLQPAVVYIGAAVTYTTLLVLAAWLAKGRATGREGWVRAGVGAGIMLAPSLADGTRVFLSAPDHVGTAIPLMLAWIAIDRMPDTWRLPVVVGLLLTWDEVADPLTGIVGAAPVIVVAAVRCYQRRTTWRVDAALMAAGALSIPLGSAVVHLVRAAGGYVVEPTGTVFAMVTALSSNIWATIDSILILFGADFSGLPPGTDAALRLLHLVGVGLAVWAFAIGARRFLSARDRVVPILVAGIAANLAAYCLTSQAAKPLSAREIAAVLPFAAALAGRVLASRLMAARLLPALGAVAVGYLGALVYWAAQPVPAVPVQPVAGWLETHHLDSGVGLYWAANSTTAESRGAVRVRVVGIACDRYLPRPWNAKRDWYDPATNRADFLIIDNDSPTSVRIAVTQFGPARRVVHIGEYTIMIWGHDIMPQVNVPVPGCATPFAG